MEQGVSSRIYYAITHRHMTRGIAQSNPRDFIQAVKSAVQ
jgi:hypothetical protein